MSQPINDVPDGMFERAMEVMKRGGNYEDFIQDEISKIVPPCPNCGAIRYSGELYYTLTIGAKVFSFALAAITLIS